MTEHESALALLRERFPEADGWRHSVQTAGGTSTAAVFGGPIQVASAQLAGDRSGLDLAEHLITAFDTAARKWLAQNLAQYEAAIRVLRKHERDGYDRRKSLACCIECDGVHPAHEPDCDLAAVLSHPLAKEVTP